MNNIKRILIVNSAEPGIKEFTAPLEDIIKNEGLNSITIEYNEFINFDFNIYIKE